MLALSAFVTRGRTDCNSTSLSKIDRHDIVLQIFAVQLHRFVEVIVLDIKIGNDAELIRAADELRRIVFIDEQGVPEDEIFDGLNHKAVHIVIFDRELPIATARLLNNGDNWRIGLVAVEESRRGEALGEKVMQAAIEYVIACDGNEIVLTAQQEVRGFYEKLGFSQCGEAVVFESGFVLIPMKLCI